MYSLNITPNHEDAPSLNVTLRLVLQRLQHENKAGEKNEGRSSSREQTHIYSLPDTVLFVSVHFFCVRLLRVSQIQRVSYIHFHYKGTPSSFLEVVTPFLQANHTACFMQGAQEEAN